MSKFETNSNDINSNIQNNCLEFKNLNFEIVLDFEFRVSNLSERFCVW